MTLEKTNLFFSKQKRVDVVSHNEQLSWSHFLVNDQLWTIPANIGKQNCLLRPFGTFKIIRLYPSESQIVILLQPPVIHVLRRLTLHILTHTFCTRYSFYSHYPRCPAFHTLWSSSHLLDTLFHPIPCKVFVFRYIEVKNFKTTPFS